MGKSIRNILLAGLVLGCAFSVACGQAADESRGLEDRVRVQEGRLDDIETYVAEQKELIENSYQFMVASLQQRRAEYLERFADSLVRYIRPEVLTLRSLMQVYGEVTRPGREVTSDRFFSQETIGLSPEKVIAGDLIYAMESHIFSSTKVDNVAARLVRDMESFYAETLQNEHRKAVALAQLAQWEEQMKQEVQTTIRDIKASSKVANADVIIAISHGRGKPSAMIGEKLVYEGDTVDGAKVVKIEPARVEFGRAGISWTRQLGQTPVEAK